MSTSASTILRQAADKFEAEPGLWFQGAAFGVDGETIDDVSTWTQLSDDDRERVNCYCAYGLVNRIAHELGEAGELGLAGCCVNRLYEVANDLGYPSIGAWNDAPGRTHEQVIAGLREAAGNEP